MTTFVGGKGEGQAVEERIESVKGLLRQTESDHEARVLNERITRLASGVSVIRVGGATDVEMVETKHRIEDALEAVRSAQKDGIITGGGTALLTAIFVSDGDELDLENDDQDIGCKILLKACESPFRQLCINAGLSEDILLQQVRNNEETNTGYDFRNHEMCDMYEAGIVDPVKVTKTALTNAVSAASTLLNTNHAIIQVE